MRYYTTLYMATCLMLRFIHFTNRNSSRKIIPDCDLAKAQNRLGTIL
jgi:hypothetical protein